MTRFHATLQQFWRWRATPAQSTLSRRGKPGCAAASWRSLYYRLGTRVWWKGRKRKDPSGSGLIRKDCGVARQNPGRVGGLVGSAETLLVRGTSYLNLIARNPAAGHGPFRPGAYLNHQHRGACRGLDPAHYRLERRVATVVAVPAVPRAARRFTSRRVQQDSGTLPTPAPPHVLLLR